MIKLHKVGEPIRPVVSFVNAPSSKLSKKLISIIKFNTKFKSKYSIKNSLDLIDKIKNLEIPNRSLLISFDVKSLFPSVPPADVLGITRTLLQKNSLFPAIVKEDLLQGLEICLKQNYFEFNGSIFQDKDSLAIGSSLSPLAAEIFMDNLEQKIMSHPLSKLCKFWYRYVDDVFSCFLGTRRQLTTFLAYLNSLHPNIQFTLEIEENNRINFMDLSIQKINNRLQFGIYHKPTHTDMLIHNSSMHPYSHKLAAFRCYVHMLLSVPMSKMQYENEVNIINP